MRQTLTDNFGGYTKIWIARFLNIFNESKDDNHAIWNAALAKSWKLFSW